jgi:hypothetical protein
MANLRAAALGLLLAAVLAGCDSGTSPTGGTSTSHGPVDLAQIRATCVAEIANGLREYTDKLPADRFFELPAGGDTLRVVTPAPVQVVTRAFALSAAECVFRATGAPKDLVDRLGVPAVGEQSGAWQGFTGVWEIDAEEGYRARVVAVR